MSTSVVRIPVSRIPLTQEQLALSIAEFDATGEPIDHPAGHSFQRALYDSVHRMVGQIAAKYSKTCNENTDDLAQECFKRVFQKLHKFDSKKGLFTTWCWHVCSNTLRRYYERGKNRRSVNLQVDPEIIESTTACGYSRSGSDEVLKDEIIDALEKLAERHPKHRTLIFEMFGNPVRGNGECITDKPMIAEAAKKMGISHARAYVFYRRTVQPFFCKRFTEN